MHTWTSGKKKFLVQFLKTCYEVLVGKYAVLNQAVKPSNFFEKMKNNAKGIQNGFRFRKYCSEKTNMCYSCRGERSDKPRILQEVFTERMQDDVVF